MKDHKGEARRALKYLRSGTDQYEGVLKHLREEVQRGGLTLKDIGTSEEELERLRVEGCKTSAQNTLKYLRSGTDQYEDSLKRLRKEVQKGGLTLKDIGTSEEELERLRPATVR